MLNQGYEPISICSIKKAIILLFLTKAEMVEVKRGKFIHSVSRAYPYPSVIRLSALIRVPFKKIELSRKNILRRDNYRCQYCGCRAVGELTIDHIVPRSRAGTDSWENLVAACVKCNNKKGNRTLEEAGFKLLNQPRRPHHLLFLKQYMGRVEDSWKPFLFMD